MSAVYSLLYKHTLFTKAIDVLVLRVVEAVALVVEAVALVNKVGWFFFLLIKRFTVLN